MKANKIRWWYDRYTRNWIIQVLDEEMNEIACEYVGNKNDIKYVVKCFSNQYGITDARKYRRDE